jgi:hypothetical protein
MRFPRPLYIYWLLALCLAAPAAVWAAPGEQDQAAACAAEYQVQADDWLSKLAAKYLGDLAAYPAIVQATNQHNALERRFARIDNPDLIEIGWLLCIPGPAGAATLPAAAPPAPLPSGSPAWEPLPPAECQELAQALSQQLGLALAAATGSFSAASPFDGSGSGCEIVAEETNRVFQVEDGLALTAKVEALLTLRGWTLDLANQFATAGLSSVSGQYNRGQAQCQLKVLGSLAPEARCSDALSPTGCFFELPLEQQLYSLRLICAQAISNR